MSDSERLKPLAVLVVENDASSRELLARVLRLHGCDADTAIGARQALSLLQQRAIKAPSEALLLPAIHGLFR